MESSFTPFSEPTNQKEDLLKPPETKQLIYQQNIDVNQYFVEKENKSSEKENIFIITFPKCRAFVSFGIIIFLAGSIIPAIVIRKLKIYYRLIIILPGIILSLITLFFSKNKIEIMKDKSNNIAIIKLINFLCFTLKTIKIDLDNIHFYCKYEEITDSEGYSSSSTKLFIINDYKNLKGIDLDTSNIRKEPAKFYYTYSDINRGKYGEKQLTDDLNNFIGSSENYENPLFFKINENMNKNEKIKYYYSINQKYKLSDYMKFSEHFFTYHLSSNYFNVKICFIISEFMVNFIIFIFYLNFFLIGRPGFLIIGILLIIVTNSIIIIIYKCLKK